MDGEEPAPCPGSYPHYSHKNCDCRCERALLLWHHIWHLFVTSAYTTEWWIFSMFLLRLGMLWISGKKSRPSIYPVSGLISNTEFQLMEKAIIKFFSWKYHMIQVRKISEYSESGFEISVKFFSLFPFVWVCFSGPGNMFSRPRVSSLGLFLYFWLQHPLQHLNGHPSMC